LWIFLALCPIALGSLVMFASHIDPLSGRWRSVRPRRPVAPALHAHTVRLRDAWRSRAAVIACSESPSTGS
jgi:hypothetical protein